MPFVSWTNTVYTSAAWSAYIDVGLTACIEAFIALLFLELAISCIYINTGTFGVFGREITKYTVIYGTYIRFWPDLHVFSSKWERAQ